MTDEELADYEARPGRLSAAAVLAVIADARASRLEVERLRQLLLKRTQEVDEALVEIERGRQEIEALRVEVGRQRALRGV